MWFSQVQIYVKILLILHKYRYLSIIKRVLNINLNLLNKTLLSNRFEFWLHFIIFYFLFFIYPGSIGSSRRISTVESALSSTVATVTFRSKVQDPRSKVQGPRSRVQGQKPNDRDSSVQHHISSALQLHRAVPYFAKLFCRIPPHTISSLGHGQHSITIHQPSIILLGDLRKQLRRRNVGYNILIRFKKVWTVWFHFIRKVKSF